MSNQKSMENITEQDANDAQKANDYVVANNKIITDKEVDIGIDAYLAACESKNQGIKDISIQFVKYLLDELGLKKINKKKKLTVIDEALIDIYFDNFLKINTNQDKNEKST